MDRVTSDAEFPPSRIYKQCLERGAEILNPPPPPRCELSPGEEYMKGSEIKDKLRKYTNQTEYVSLRTHIYSVLIISKRHSRRLRTSSALRYVQRRRWEKQGYNEKKKEEKYVQNRICISERTNLLGIYNQHSSCAQFFFFFILHTPVSPHSAVLKARHSWV